MNDKDKQALIDAEDVYNFIDNVRRVVNAFDQSSKNAWAGETILAKASRLRNWVLTKATDHD